MKLKSILQMIVGLQEIRVLIRIWMDIFAK